MNQNLKVLGNFEKASQELLKDTNNAVISVFEKQKHGNGILDSAVFTLKDVYATKTGVVRSSSKILENFHPSYNATVVEKLQQAGALLVAKVNNDELALGGTGKHSAYGLIVNPKDSLRLAGGSSSGSVATFSENISFAIGSDTGDSVRLPASYNGIVGFKPSYGAISRYGLFAYASSLDTVAYFAHNVNDIYYVSKALYGQDSKDMSSVKVPLDNLQETKPKKIIAFDFSQFCDSEVNETFNKLLNKLQKQSINVDIIQPNLDILRCIKPVYQVISFSEASSNLSNLTGICFGSKVNGNDYTEIMTKTRSEKFGHMVSERLALGSYFLYSENQEEIFIKAMKARRVIRDYLNSLHQSADILIYPSFASIAPLLNSSTSYDVMDYILTGSNLAGNPSLSIPLGNKNNMPFNLTIDSKIYGDSDLLNYALYLEKLIGAKNE
ncbi:aspartyl/glutamyl-tRNA(Asn/Gln) amidotransferase subunit A [Mycoplasmopsis citelli]|uniref:Aspartyl/glutamyl-tRNA(Asn/Gln) amidotransferase subunit A n=1 Tax=Mycoplasmopsis citelli TaxID=171281 RepID=A0A449B1W1_9BACT|nr:amidase family protein [Mycoplasmopsis citelli]VEU74563.1 aspartyl/glutamyl-tRNA(Asn/Gln) amidotransferase subunit A [Mycoplasmopsis citelli]